MLTFEIIRWIDVLRVLVSLSFLSASSWYDYKSREVSNRVWMLFAPIGFILTLLQCYLEYSWSKTSLIYLWIISFTVTTGISFALFYAGFFGGADAKALICLSIAIPFYPRFSPMRFRNVIPLFPLAVLVNSVLVSSILVLAILCYNTVRYVQLKGAMFKGFEDEPFWRKILVFMTGIKVDLEKIKKGSHYMPLEYLTKEKNGEITRHLKVSPRIEEEDSRELEDLEKISGQIWATPGLPFLIFVTIGFIIALFFGDLITWLVNLMLAF